MTRTEAIRGKELLDQLLRDSNERAKALQELVRKEIEHGKKIIRARQLYNMATDELRNAVGSIAAYKANATRRTQKEKEETRP